MEKLHTPGESPNERDVGHASQLVFSIVRTDVSDVSSAPRLYNTRTSKAMPNSRYLNSKEGYLGELDEEIVEHPTSLPQ